MLDAKDAAIVKGLLAQGHKQHSIAAFFGENGGRIAEISTGKKFAEIRPAPADILPVLPEKTHRFVNPRAPIDEQITQLQAFIKDPPENGRWIVFTPKLADWVLTNLNNHNRRPRPRNIKRFAEAMGNGAWEATGDTVKFSREGTLLDGQNRLAACLAAGRTFKTLVVFGRRSEAFSKIDNGAKRTGSDIMAIAGVPFGYIVASAVRYLMIGEDRGRIVDNTELHTYFREHVDHVEMQEAARRAIAAGKLLPQGALAALFYQFEHKSKTTAKTFAADLAARRGNARTLLLQVKRVREQAFGRVHENQLQAMIILTWNAYRNNERLRAAMLKWTEMKEFPAIV